MGAKTLVLTVTRKCNLNCSYCISGKGSETLSFENAKGCIDRFLEEDSGEKTIIYFGGEPLLEKELLKIIICYVGRKGIRVMQKVVTNGTVYDKEFFDFLRREDVRVGVSLDGSKESHDRNRGGSYSTVKENIKRIMPDAVLYLVSQNSLNGFSESVISMLMDGHKVKLDFERWCSWSRNSIDLLKEEIAKLDKFLSRSKKYKEGVIIPDIRGCRKSQVCLFTDGRVYDCPDLPYLIEKEGMGNAQTRKEGKFRITTMHEGCNVCLMYSKDFKRIGREEEKANKEINELFQLLRKNAGNHGELQEVCNN